jgi:membrane protein DedA with SNARE-associated domain
MSPTLSAYILKYGYIAIFSLVFLQEIGVPNPVPNEVVLLFSGYLRSVGTLDCITVLLTVIAADVLGSSCLYMTFYFFGQRLLQKWPHVMPSNTLTNFTAKMAHQKRWSIYVGRHIPFIRGYTAVAAGLLQIPPRIFLPAVLLSAMTWSGGYVIAGTLLGHAYIDAVSKLAIGKLISVLLVLLCIIIFLWPRIYECLKSKKPPGSGWSYARGDSGGKQE